MRAGWLKLSEPMKTWRTHPEKAKNPDKAPCRICSALDGITLTMQEEFPNTGQLVQYGFDRLKPPAHPSCNCEIEYSGEEEPIYRLYLD